MTFFADIADRDEDARIDTIGHQAVHHKKPVGFIVEDDVKADRYISKLRTKYPAIRVVSRGVGPVKGTVWVKVGPPLAR